uniref:Uncharacterized protein n=1 Tax=Arundo donax TaxID=35708 RepID=A0A0A9BYF4_ARUDO
MSYYSCATVRFPVSIRS